MLTVPYKEIRPQEARKLHEQNTLFVDVREPEEFAQMRIAGAQPIPLSELAGRFGEIPKSQPVVLYCRSAQAAAWLAAKGYSNLLNLDGGIMAWYQAGLAYEGFAVGKLVGGIQGYPLERPAAVKPEEVPCS